MENINNAAAIINEWNSLSTQAQINFITTCTFKIIKAQPTCTRYEINEVVNEAWLRITDNMTAGRLTAINERRAAQGKAPTTLAGIVYNAAPRQHRRYQLQREEARRRQCANSQEQGRERS